MRRGGLLGAGLAGDGPPELRTLQGWDRAYGDSDSALRTKLASGGRAWGQGTVPQVAGPRGGWGRGVGLGLGGAWAPCIPEDQVTAEGCGSPRYCPLRPPLERPPSCPCPCAGVWLAEGTQVLPFG